jgi:hypothetical protein
MMDDEFLRLRILQGEISDEIYRHRCPGSVLQVPAFVGRVTTALPALATISHFYLVYPVGLLGTEAEGSLGSLSLDTSTSVLVCMLGPHTPAVGDDVICRFVRNRWVAERMGKRQPATVALAGCLCAATPIKLHMTSSNTTSNGGMFQNCDITYDSTPSEYTLLYLGTSSFLSTQSFTDLETGDSFRYYMICASALYQITRIFVTSIFGSPFMEPARYTWLMFAPGNTCAPFRLSNGQIFSGGDSTCAVAISV